MLYKAQARSHAHIWTHTQHARTVQINNPTTCTCVSAPEQGHARERGIDVYGLKRAKKFNVVFQSQRLKTARLIVLGWLIFRGMPTRVPWRRHLCCMSTPVHDHTHTHIRTRTHTRTHVQYKHTLKHYLLRANYMSNRVIAATLQTQIRTFKHTVQTTVFIGPVGYLSISAL